ncbi:unnamed protein product [Strongylus vulgaris]|uniref:Uncharacterized protein n=1 Tax=Strongylus vulgaris TaxID=40348 RepID=A0A3P7LXN3_STRVU|nr:unnamed protein product [Strongylus vulgaris]
MNIANLGLASGRGFVLSLVGSSIACCSSCACTEDVAIAFFCGLAGVLLDRVFDLGGAKGLARSGVFEHEGTSAEFVLAET